MPVSEKYISGSISGDVYVGAQESELLFNVTDHDDSVAAETAFLAAVGVEVPTTHRGMPLSRYKIDEVGGRAFEARAIYERPGGFEPGTTRISFNTSGEQQHITQSLAQIAKYPSGTAPDSAGAIGATAEGVDGADIVVGVFDWEITKTFADAYVDDAYMTVLENLTGRTNSAIWRGRAIGEVLFMGASGAQIIDQPWEITFRFATSRNRTGLTIGAITGIDKKGWELLDVRYKKVTLGTGADAVVTMVPKFVYVHRVFESGTFTSLGVDP